MKHKKAILFMIVILAISSFATAATSWVVTAGSCEKKICTINVGSSPNSSSR